MSDNILKKSLAVTYEDFLNGVFGKRPKPEWVALTTLFSEIVTGRSTLVSDLSKTLRADATRAESKRVQERVSGWLANYDFVESTGGWLLRNIPETGRDGPTFAVDFSDISKVFGGRGHDELLGEAISAVMGRTGGEGWIVEDRGMDGAEHLWTLKRDNRHAVVRVNDMKRDAFGDGLKIDDSLQSVPFFDAMLHVHTGDRRVKIRCRPGVVQHCRDPHARGAVTHDVRVLVVESRFDEKSIYLYVVCPDWVLDSPAQMAIYAKRAYPPPKAPRRGWLQGVRRRTATAGRLRRRSS